MGMKIFIKQSIMCVITSSVGEWFHGPAPQPFYYVTKQVFCLVAASTQGILQESPGSCQDLRVEKPSERERMKHTKDGANLWTSVYGNNFHWETTASVETSLPGRPCIEHGLSEASSPAARVSHVCLRSEVPVTEADVCGPCLLRALDPS